MLSKRKASDANIDNAQPAAASKGERKINSLDDDAVDAAAVGDDEKDDESDVQSVVAVSEMKGFVPKQIKPFMELRRQKQMILADLQKCKRDNDRANQNFTKGTVRTDTEEEVVFHNIKLQFAIMRSHHDKLDALKEQMTAELIQIGADEFVEKKEYKVAGEEFEYTGFLKNGKVEVYGKIKYADGEAYEGEYKNDVREGMGKAWTDSWKYVGDWKNGDQDGKGVSTYTNGDTYDGEWKEGMKNGHGMFTWASGAKYEGKWIDGTCKIPKLSNFNITNE